MVLESNRGREVAPDNFGEGYISETITDKRGGRNVPKTNASDIESMRRSVERQRSNRVMSSREDEETR